MGKLYEAEKSDKNITTATQAVKENQLPLAVDLDGTLLKTDTLLESILILLKQQPLLIFSLLFWMLKGKAYFKQQIANRVDLPVDSLPYHSEFLVYLQQAYKDGRKLILATAANEKIARSIADHLGIFSGIIASTPNSNLRGRQKLKALEKQFGKRGFIYAGNGRVDLPIWAGAASGIIVNASPAVVRRAKKHSAINQVFAKGKSGFLQFLKAIRMHQWVKNLLIFVPLITSHSYIDPQLTFQAIWAFVAFSLCASSVYVINDLLDLEVDRRHTKKRNRPFAAGNLSLKVGLFAFPLLVIPGFLIALSLNTFFLGTLIAYYLITFIYSFVLKKMALVDVFTLAFLFTLRIFSGAAAIDVVVSQWLFAFSIFIFVSLAFVKRYSELNNLPKDKVKVGGRGYLAQDVFIVGNFGIASAYISVVVFALYIHSDQVELLYHYPQRLWAICVLLFFWVSRVWLLAYRGELNEDPILFAVKDRTSFVVGILAAITIFLAI